MTPLKPTEAKFGICGGCVMLPLFCFLMLFALHDCGREDSPSKETAKISAPPESKEEHLRKIDERQKRQQISKLVDEFASGLPSPMGQLVLIKVGVTSEIDKVNHPFTIHWDNTQRTKAKVNVSTVGSYTWHISPNGNIARATEDYKGGSFACEQDANGAWQFSR